MLQGEPRWGKTQSPAAAAEGCVPSRHCPSQQVSSAVARSVGSHLLLLPRGHRGHGDGPILQPMCRLLQGTSLLRVPKQTGAPGDSHDCRQWPWGCLRGAMSHHGAGAGRAPAAPLCLSSLKAQCVTMRTVRCICLKKESMKNVVPILCPVNKAQNPAVTGTLVALVSLFSM